MMLSNDTIKSAILEVFSNWGGKVGENNARTITHKADFFCAVAYELARMSQSKEDMPSISYTDFRNDSEDTTKLEEQIKRAAIELNDDGTLRVGFSTEERKVKGGVTMLDLESEKKAKEARDTAETIAAHTNPDTIAFLIKFLQEKAKAAASK